ncbi:MAG: xanthine dehydrogenase family protein molybdopterin-binding subunit [Acidobacteria bacterium]|nr:xanthine dehydrogenase family protein molybdopterin-binding subunit [Acidobacteriota bacterium]
MPEYKWPEAGERKWIGKRVSRSDGPDKVSGRAKYSYDVNLNGMLYGAILRSPYAHARVKSIDTSAAEALSGVKAVHVMKGPGSELQWAGAEIVGVAAVSEEVLEDALREIKVEYEKLPHLVREETRPSDQDRLQTVADEQQGEPDQAFEDADVVHEGYYGIPVITHCCLESHGMVVRWEDDTHLTAWASTQAVSRLAGQFAEADGVGVEAGNVRTLTPHMGGGFGSKFGIDVWGVETAILAKQAGAPVKMLLPRDAELMVAGGRPSYYTNIRVAAKKDGTLTAWESDTWGTSGVAPRGGAPPLPYVFNIPHQKKKYVVVLTNTGAARAWRAPRHPQACVLTMGALEDLAAKLNMDPLHLFKKNLGITGPRAETYREELDKAAEMIEWKKKWHPRGKGGSGYMRRGLGLALHTWGGRSHTSNCNILIHPDGSVEVNLGSQDLGVGTRTVIAMTAAETFSLPLHAVHVNLGDSRYPQSGASGGSTTVGGVTSATRRGSQDALEDLLRRTAPALNAAPENLEARDGRIQVKGDPSRSLSWKQACARLGVTSIAVTGKNPGPGSLNSSGVGGVQMAEVAVDIETGVVKLEKFVAVQDCGLIINLKTAESQVYGAVIMGVCFALYEEKIMDQATGRMLNPNMEFYKLAGIGDIGEIVVHMMTGPGYDDRGVIGLGEPPVISPGAAIANAVANAIGVRVPTLPLTPDRVLAALEKGGTA